MAGGRPTKYQEEYNQIAIDHFRKGKTVSQLCAEFEVARSTIYKWAEDNEQFSDTLRVGSELAQSYWETVHHAKTLGQEQSQMDIKKTSERGLEFILKTRFRNDYSERQEISHDTAKIEINISGNESKL